MEWRKLGKKRLYDFYSSIPITGRPLEMTILYTRAHCKNYIFLFMLGNNSHRLGIGGHVLTTSSISIAYTESFILYTTRKNLQSISDCFASLIAKLGV